MTTQPKRYRWVCPLCGGGRLLGQRPRKDATARYCLPCSKKTERLVERECPVLAERRRVREHRAVARAVRKEKRERAKAAAPYLFDDGAYDARRVYAKVWRLAQGLEPGLVRTRAPRLQMRNSSAGTRGWACYGPWKIIVNRYHGQRRSGGITETIIHEVAHFLARARGGHWHDEIFRGALSELETACQEAGLEFHEEDRLTW